MPLAITPVLFASLLFQQAAPRATCTFFVLKDCPIANRYAPEMKRIIREYTPRGVRFILEFEDQDLSPGDASSHAKEFGLLVDVKIDAGHKDAKAAKVMISPSAVLASGPKTVYRGRIDDSYAGVGKPRTVRTTHDLRDALDAFLAGRPVRNAETPAVGCQLF